MANARESWKGIATEQTLTDLVNIIDGTNTDVTQKTQIVGATGTQAEVVAASASKSGSDNVILVQTIDASGNIGTGGSAVDKASFIVGSGKGSVMMGVVSTDTVGAGQEGAVQITGSRELAVYNPPISMLAEYRSPTDFQAVYASPSTLILTGAQFTIDDTVCRVTSVMVKNASGVFTGYFNGRGGISLQLSVGTLTIAGATPFLNTDLVYDVNIVGQKKAYDISTDTTKVTVQNPQNLNFVVDVLVNATNTANGTVYYPSSTGMQMDGYLNMSLSGQLIDVGGITITVEGTNDPSATPNWIQLYGDDLKNNTMVNIKNTVSDTFFWSFDSLNVSTIRVKVVYTTNGANTSIINMRRA